MGRRWTEGISRDDRLTSYPTATGPDIRFAVRLCARYRASPRTSHRQAVKRIFGYPKFTPELGLWYSLEGSRMPTMPAAGLTAMYPCLPRSEYIAAASRRSRLLWMKATLSDFGLRFGKIPLLVDSTSAIS
ncbi:hypothetical protein U9M48_040575 [Paspalum notatum var. saurae]|uniref:Uncharacterized protein n=1 Tax=Paspalum notatum var. saurae TaxID=547442 RepID=A0AAQ3UMF0_PASNO